MAFVPIDITPEQLADLDAQHDGVFCARGTERAPFLFVLRLPTARELRAYAAMVRAKGADVLDANHKLLSSLCVYPAPSDVSRQLDRWPACAGTILNSEGWSAFSGGALDEHQK